jgi:uncharacterized protein YjiS (DUF1127 family)
MSGHTVNQKFQFELPTLSYIDAKWEEPNLRAAAEDRRPAHQTGLMAWFSVRLDAYRAWRRTQRSIAELGTMSDYELGDIGLTRSDLGRVFDPSFNDDLRRRGLRD